MFSKRIVMKSAGRTELKNAKSRDSDLNKTRTMEGIERNKSNKKGREQSGKHPSIK